MPATSRPLIAAAVLTAALAACSDPYAVDPQYDVLVDTFFVYGINEVPIASPSALVLFGATTGTPATPATTALNFDVAVDVTAGGDVRLVTPRAFISVVPNPGTPPHSVGLQVVSEAFDGLRTAPSGGYAYDSLLTVSPGETVVVQSRNPAICPPYFGTAIYGKLVVDSVRMNPARVFLRTTIDPNCDFRSLVPGKPED